jgi:hypothetical protein
VAADEGSVGAIEILADQTIIADPDHAVVTRYIWIGELEILVRIGADRDLGRVGLDGARRVGAGHHPQPEPRDLDAIPEQRCGLHAGASPIASVELTHVVYPSFALR